MENEERWNQIGNITLKLALQISNLIDICEGQQKIIANLVERVDRLEGIAPRTNRKVKVSEEELRRYKDFYDRYSDWGDQYR